jgi:signal peptidase I
MAPTLKKGDRFMVDMRDYNSHAPRRGDVVVIATPPMRTLMVKRVVAVAGDVINPSVAQFGW